MTPEQNMILAMLILFGLYIAFVFFKEVRRDIKRKRAKPVNHRTNDKRFRFYENLRQIADVKGR